ncbi:MAG: S49 family peptidase, partial [Pseudolabrys sp.]
MAAELDGTAPARALINLTPKRSHAMATNETERIEDQPTEPQEPAAAGPATADAPPEPATTAPAPASAEPATAKPTPEAGTAERMRAEFAEVAAITAQAARLGVTLDAADALKKGIAPDALRRSVLDTLSQRSEATSVIAAAPSTPTAGDSPIV